MPSRHPRATALAVALAVGGAIAPTTAAAQPSGLNDPALASVHGQGNPYSVPPILRPARPSELRAMRRVEAEKARRLAYRLPPTARYSSAEMDAYASQGTVLPHPFGDTR